MTSAQKAAEALLSQGQAFFNAGNWTEAEKAFAEAARLVPGAWQIHFNLGLCRERLKQHEGAFLAYEAAHRLVPDHIPSLANLAAKAFHLDKNDLALQLTLRLTELDPGNAWTYDNLGQILLRLRQYEAAELSFQNALLLNPKLFAAHNHLGVALKEQNKLEAAAAAFRNALDCDPRQGDAYANLASLALAQEAPEEALVLYRQALELAPDSPQAWTNLGYGLKAAGYYEEALAAHCRALEIAPQHALAHWNYSICLLTLGRLEAGWQEYEWGAAAGTRSRFSNRLPCWQGEPLAGRRLLLRAEQGLGDTLQFLRFVQGLEATGATITLECQPALLEIASHARGIDRIVAQASDLPADAFGCDLYLPLMSLPKLLRVTLADLPGTMPYLEVPAGQHEKGCRTLGVKRRPRVGLVWAGNPLHPNDRRRSCPLGDLAPVLAVPGIEFVSLQMNAGGQPLPPEMTDPTPAIRDFADTAGLLANLDLLITVDTAAAHLAGALGQPVWLMLAHDADWRWLRERDDSPWYPSFTLYRQKLPGQWLPVAERLARDLAQLFSGAAG